MFLQDDDGLGLRDHTRGEGLDTREQDFSKWTTDVPVSQSGSETAPQEPTQASYFAGRCRTGVANKPGGEANRPNAVDSEVQADKRDSEAEEREAPSAFSQARQHLLSSEQQGGQALEHTQASAHPLADSAVVVQRDLLNSTHHAGSVECRRTSLSSAGEQVNRFETFRTSYTQID